MAERTLSPAHRMRRPNLLFGKLILCIEVVDCKPTHISAAASPRGQRSEGFENPCLRGSQPESSDFGRANLTPSSGESGSNNYARRLYRAELAPLISLMNSSLLSKRPSCLVNCSIASQGCMLLSVRRSIVTAS